MRVLPLIISLITGAAPAAEITHPAEPAAAAPLPGGSLYQLQLPLTDSHGAATDLSAFRGHPVLISMFYARCGAACPMLIDQVSALVDTADRDDLRVVMVTLAPDQDDPAALEDLVKRHGLDERWLVAAPPVGRERELAATLGITYRVLDTGHINHSSVITLLDPDGVPVERIEGLSQPSTPLLEALAAIPAGD